MNYHIHPAYASWLTSDDCTPASRKLHANLKGAGYDLIRADLLERSGGYSEEFLSHWSGAEGSVLLWEGHANAVSTVLRAIPPQDVTGSTLWLNQHGEVPCQA